MSLTKELAAWCRANDLPLSECLEVYHNKRAKLPIARLVKG